MRSHPLLLTQRGVATLERTPRIYCWTGETVATYTIQDVPAHLLYSQYADLSRMTEWSPLLESVSVDPAAPRFSVWVMNVPRPLQAAALTFGYPSTLSWEAELDAPGPPLMTWR